jgi:hypothetical protein
VEAEGLLKDKEASCNYISYHAALVLHARLMLLQENFDEAQRLSQQVIDEAGLPGNAINTAGYSSLWTNNSSNEKLFAYNNFTFPLANFREKENGDFIVVPSKIAFEENDIRKAFSKILFLMKKNGSTTPLLRPLIGKYRLSAEDEEPKDINRIRLAEAYFIAAESYAQDNKPGKARETINLLLATRGASPLPEGMNKTELLEKILDEKQKEFVGEGLRFFDLKRLNKDIIRYKVDSESIDRTISTDDFRRVFPIPLSEIKQNKEIEQNPGWESIISNIN